MFGKHDGGHHKKGHGGGGGNLLFGFFRFLLSLVIFSILLFGIYSAYKHFSGYDPIKLNPGQILDSMTSKEKIMNLFFGLLTVDGQDIKEKLVPGSEEESDNPLAELTNSKPAGNPIFKFAIVTDSHNDNTNLSKALKQANTDGDLKFVVGLGDYTEVGTIEELGKVKKVFDENGLRYFVTAGDHDLWDARDKKDQALVNFTETFGRPYQSFTVENVKFILLYNSDNYLGLGQEQLDWLKSELGKSASEGVTQTIVMMHEPLYHPSSDRFMGKVTPALKDEARNIINLLKSSGVSHVFYGDIHFFTRYQDPESSLAMTTIGAVTSDRNPQTPRYAVVTVYDSGGLDIQDKEIN